MAFIEVRAMRGRCFGLLLFLTCLIVWSKFATAGTRKVNSDRPPSTTVNFQLYRDYLIIVQGSVGPLKGLNFLLDTGATPSVMDPWVARKLRLDSTPIGVAVLKGTAEGGITTLPNLQLGPIRKENLRVLIEDMSFIQKALPSRIDGIVGLDVLGENAFVIDYEARELRFGAAPVMASSMSLQMKQGLAFVDAIVNQETVHLLLDTGAPSLVLFQEMPDPVGGIPHGGIGAVDRKRERIISFTLGAANFGRKTACIVENHKDTGHDFDGLMSPTALGLTKVAVDLSRGVLAFSRDR
jgi:hypothetical protein